MISHLKIRGTIVKTYTLCLTALFCLVLSSCGSLHGPTKELDALLRAKDEVLTQWAKELDANPTEAGVDAARTYFESKKVDLITKREALAKAPQGMNSDWMTKWFDSNASDLKVLDAIELKLSVGGYDSPAHQKFKLLRKDFEAAAHGK